MGGGAVQIRIPGPVPDGLTVFETMRAEADSRIALWPRHRARLCLGCAAVGFPLDLGRVEAALETVPRGAAQRVRLSVDAAGQVTVAVTVLPPAAARWRVMLAEARLSSGDPWLRIKSSRRPVYDAVRAALPPGIDEAILLNDQGEICDGTITSVFLRRDGVLLTPPLSAGLLPGVLRAELLSNGDARVARLTPADLADGDLFCGNALRGLIPVQLGAGI